jgi:hypothetical protein
MKHRVNHLNFLRVAVVLAGTLAASADLLAQQGPASPEAAQLAQHQKNLEQLQQVLNDKSGYAEAIVLRWEDAAKASGKWDPNFETDMRNALLKLPTEKLLAAGEASTYESMTAVLATGRPLDKPPTNLLGTFSSDLVYTPVAPCRILDTRNVTSGGFAGPLAGGQSYLIDADNPSGFGSAGANQGGSTTAGCGIPYSVASAIAISITAISPANTGFLTAYGYSGPVPTAATMIYYQNQILTTTTINPITPGTGPDFNVYISQTMQLAIDVVGYFAENVATALDCTTANSAMTAVPVNSWTAIDATCPTGFTATGGGYFSTEGTLGYPGVWTLSMPGTAYGFNGWRTWVDNQNSGPRNVQTWAQCCQVPGR